VNLHYTHGTNTGYARYGTKLAEALARRDIPIRDEPEYLSVWVAGPSSVRGWWAGQRRVISTMWETENLPEGMRESFDNFDQIIVPSEQNREIFSAYHSNVAKVPLGIDTWEWRYRPRPEPDRRFVFLTCGNGNRKGVDLVIEAFRRVFGPYSSHRSPRPILIVKSIRAFEGAVGERIQNVTGFISDLEEQELYASAHCYLQPSRGEGFGLMPLQAIASGCPTVLTEAHGHLEFSTLGWGISASRSKADYFLHGEGGTWWEPDLDELCARMEQIYENYDLAEKEARISSDIAHRLFGWDRVAELFVEAVGKQHFAFDAGIGLGDWTEASLRRYPVMVNRFWVAEMAGLHYQFHPGRTYFETADVKRILFESNVLDPACVDAAHPEASGLTVAELERFGDYSASHSYCHTCGQKLGTGEIYQP
jgi:glycosyltransferase involved in cell wall biosynthesis